MAGTNRTALYLIALLGDDQTPSSKPLNGWTTVPVVVHVIPLAAGCAPSSWRSQNFRCKICTRHGKHDGRLSTVSRFAPPRYASSLLMKRQARQEGDRSKISPVTCWEPISSVLSDGLACSAFFESRLGLRQMAAEENPSVLGIR